MNGKEAVAELVGWAKTLPPSLRHLCEIVLNDPRFAEAPASKDKHHAYPGGLAVHTLEVVKQAWGELPPTYYGKSEDAFLTVAAIWHDYMKVREYEVDPDKLNTLRDTPYRTLIYHIAGSFAEFYAAAKNAGIEQEVIDVIGHAILAHHGRKEWSSPVEPQTELAYILHAADMWSSRFGPGVQRAADTPMYGEKK